MRSDRKPPQRPLAKRRVGRPRASGTEPRGAPGDEILRAAARLFAEHGFDGTSTGRIAAAAGLRQSAIFHWYPSKEAILERLFAEGWDRSLAYFASVARATLPAAVKFCLCLTYDARLVAGSDPHIQLMIVPPELRQPRFSRLLRKRQRLIGYLQEFIRRAIGEGDFRRLDPAQAARMALAVDEVVLDVARAPGRRTPRAHAAEVVDFALHALVSDRRRVATITRAAARYAVPGT